MPSTKASPGRRPRQPCRGLRLPLSYFLVHPGQGGSRLAGRGGRDFGGVDFENPSLWTFEHGPSTICRCDTGDSLFPGHCDELQNCGGGRAVDPDEAVRLLICGLERPPLMSLRPLDLWNCDRQLPMKETQTHSDDSPATVFADVGLAAGNQEVVGFV